MSTSEKRPEVVAVKVEFDFASRMVNLTPTKVNGVALVSPQVVPLAFDQLITLACQLVMRDVKARAAGMSTATAAPPKIVTLGGG